MPRIRRHQLPRALFDHLVVRVQEREIGSDQLIMLARWLNSEPEVPTGRWFKRFPGMIACGEGELVKTFLRIGQIPTGEEVL